jgi:hypothetical protein
MTGDAVVLAEIVIPVNVPIDLVAYGELEMVPHRHRRWYSNDKSETISVPVARIVNIAGVYLDAKNKLELHCTGTI